MPLSVDRSSEAAVSTLFDQNFMDRLFMYLGYHPDTPVDAMPISISDLFSQAIATCETEQWRFILPKDVSIQFPSEAFCYTDKLLFLPFGLPDEDGVTITYTDLDEDEASFTDFTVYAGEPCKLYCSDWSVLVNDCHDEPYPITVTYRPGYTSYAQIPKTTVRALQILTYHYHEFRDSMISNGSTMQPVPAGYEQNRDHAYLNCHRAIKYIVDDWAKVAPR